MGRICFRLFDYFIKISLSLYFKTDGFGHHIFDNQRISSLIMEMEHNYISIGVRDEIY